MRFLPYLVVIALFSCEPPPPLAALPDADYFPVQMGKYRIYNVTEALYRLGQSATTRHYWLREQTGESFRTLAGDTAYVITYAHRFDNKDSWVIDSMGTVQQSAAECLLTVGSRTVVKLAFPAFDGQRWNGNRYNALGNDEFRLQHCHLPFRINQETIDRTVTVVEQNDSTLVSQDKRVAVYGYQIGLVYAERQQLRFCATDPGCGQPTAIAYGIRQFIRLTEYGHQ